MHLFRFFLGPFLSFIFASIENRQVSVGKTSLVQILFSNPCVFLSLLQDPFSWLLFQFQKRFVLVRVVWGEVRVSEVGGLRPPTPPARGTATMQPKETFIH